MFLEVGDGLLNGIGEFDEIQIALGNRAFPDHVVDEITQIRPVGLAHNNDGKIPHLLRLDEREGFKQFVHGSKSPWHDHKTIAVFHEQGLADKEVIDRHATVEVGAGLLFEGELDVAANTRTSRIACPAIRRLHDAWSASGHYSESHPGNGRTHLAGKAVIGMILRETGRTKNCDAWAHKMQRAKTPDEVHHHTEQQSQIPQPRIGAAEQSAVLQLPAEDFLLLYFAWKWWSCGWFIGLQNWRCHWGHSGLEFFHLNGAKGNLPRWTFHICIQMGRAPFIDFRHGGGPFLQSGFSQL